MASAAHAVPETAIDSWTEFIDIIEDAPAWIYRGQASANWPLMSTLERATPEGYPREFAEFNLTREFQRRARTCLQPHEVPDKPGEWLALMQHYGAPTRLLDFTHSPFVAAYFAFEDRAADGCDRCAIWMLEPGWFLTHFGRAALKAGGIFGHSYENLITGIEATKMAAPAEAGTEAEKRGRDYFMLGAVLALLIDNYAQWKAPAGVAVFEPDRLSVRMSTQQGVFLWPGDVSLTMMQNVSAVPNSRGIRKITIPIGQRGRVLDQLRLMNITRTSLFPGLAGFAESFRTALVRESVADRNMRQAARWLERFRQSTGENPEER